MQNKIMKLWKKQPPVFSASINPTTHNFGIINAGQGAQTARQFVITNTGNQTITGLTATITSLYAGRDFEISAALSSTTIAPGGTATISIRPMSTMTSVAPARAAFAVMTSDTTPSPLRTTVLGSIYGIGSQWAVPGTLTITGNNGINFVVNLNFTLANGVSAGWHCFRWHAQPTPPITRWHERAYLHFGHGPSASRPCMVTIDLGSSRRIVEASFISASGGGNTNGKILASNDNANFTLLVSVPTGAVNQHQLVRGTWSGGQNFRYWRFGQDAGSSWGTFGYCQLFI